MIDRADGAKVMHSGFPESRRQILPDQRVRCASVDGAAATRRAKGNAEATIQNAKADAESISIRARALKQNANDRRQLRPDWSAPASRSPVAGAGGRAWDRTRDPYHVKVVLYR